ncbi:GAF domain-containing protein [Nocardia sp. NPDC050378]|uniref:GAF domain-containing protein n=1 Tax=Nocardia sp. NPDC050378 TaxID=3155400 RepID=UPI0033EC84C3
MILDRWQLVETLGEAHTWSMLTSGTTPREWTSYERAISAQLRPLVVAAHDSGEPIDKVLPKSRKPWSEHRFRAVPVVWPGSAPHAVKVWVGRQAPTEELGVSPFRIDARTRRVSSRPGGLGAHFGAEPREYRGAEPYQLVERFDGALDLVAALNRSEPGSRWSGIATIRSGIGPRSMLIATRNETDDRFQWRGVSIDVTDSIAPQPKSLEATTLELLRDTQPGLYLAIIDTVQARPVRWVTEPLPGVRWHRVDDRDIPHPEDRVRILEVREQILAGATNATLPGLRLATEWGGWLVADVEVSPLPGAPGDGTPLFVLAQVRLAPGQSEG